MKKYLLFWSIAISAVLSIAQQTIAAPGWAQTYGVDTYTTEGKLNDDPFYGSGHDFPVAMAKMPDGGFVVAGQIDLPELYFHAAGTIYGMSALVRYAPDGSILWQKELRQSNNKINNGTPYNASSHIHAIATDALGNIFVAGGKGNTDNGGEQPFVAKFNSDGGLIWDNGFNGGSALVGVPPQATPIGVGTISYMSLTTDGGVVVSLAQSRPNLAYTIPVLAKFNSDGSLAFAKAYDNTIQYLGSTPVCQSKDGSRYVMAFLYATDGSALGSRYGLVLLVTDAAGNIIAQRGYNHSDNPGESPRAILATADGGFAVLSGPYSDGYFGILRKFTSDLSAEVFEKHIGITPGQPFGYLATNSLVETADGGFLIGGATQNQASSNGDVDLMLMKLSSGGALQFVSLVGGPKNEGYPMSWSQTTAFGIETADGGYGLAGTSASYHTGNAVSGGFYDIPDWWMVKTDSNRKVRGFNGTMLDQPLNTYTLSGTPEAGASVSVFQAPGYPYGLNTAAEPHFVFDDLGAKNPPNLPVVIFQASSPRIMSSRKAEAVVGQHFAYHTLAAFFDPAAHLTYSASGLPQGFVIDASTGVISGVAGAGTETSSPIAIGLSVTDGVDTAQLTLLLTIGDGVPVFTVNGTDQPTANLADTVLTFATRYPGSRAGRQVSVQSATNSQGPWTDIDTGLSGYMAPDFTSGTYVLGTTNYPAQNGVYFRSRVITKGFTTVEVASNVVGPFDLASGKARAGKTVFRMKRNGLRADLDFRVTELAAASGIALRVQSTRTPSVEASWKDLTDAGGNNISTMSPDGDSLHYALLKQLLPAGSGIYFRAIAAGAGIGRLDVELYRPQNNRANHAPVSGRQFSRQRYGGQSRHCHGGCRWNRNDPDPRHSDSRPQSFHLDLYDSL